MNSEYQLSKLVADLEEEKVLEIVRQRIDDGDDLLQIINECNEGMREVGERYERGEYFIAGLIMSGEIFRQVVEIVQPLLEDQMSSESSGKVLVGTVSGDIHDLGKNMLSLLLSSHGFVVIDLGVDVSAEVFAEKVIEHKPDFVGLSCLITASFTMMKNTIDALRQAAEENDLSFPIIVGGGMVDEQIKDFVGADYWMPDAMSGVRLCQDLMKEKSELSKG
jgi:methylmalonyl-CoA mutase cobalamin-binding domain/chain